MKQLLLLREKVLPCLSVYPKGVSHAMLLQALKRYKASSRSSESSDFEAMTSADAFFRYAFFDRLSVRDSPTPPPLPLDACSKEAESSTRPGSDWDFDAERSSLQVRALRGLEVESS